MRKLLPTVLLAVPFLASAALADDGVVRLSEPVKKTERYEDFGAVLPERLPEGEALQSLSGAIANFDELAGQQVLIETEVQQVCRKKGCFFIARDGDAVARVRFKDYGFFIPTDSAGKTVKLAGKLERVEVSEEQAAHFAEDLGREPGAERMADFEYRVTATAVRIPRT